MKQNFGIALDPIVVDEADRRRGLISRSAYLEDSLRTQFKEGDN
jgi:hypothetical protein